MPGQDSFSFSLSFFSLFLHFQCCDIPDVSIRSTPLEWPLAKMIRAGVGNPQQPPSHSPSHSPARTGGTRAPWFALPAAGRCRHIGRQRRAGPGGLGRMCRQRQARRPDAKCRISPTSPWKVTWRPAAVSVRRVGGEGRVALETASGSSAGKCFSSGMLLKLP